MGIVAAHDALLRSTERARRNRRRRYIIAGATVVVMAMYMALRGRSSPPPAHTQVAVAPPASPPVVAAPAPTPPVVTQPAETKPTPTPVDADAQARRSRAARRRADSIAAANVAPVDTTPGKVRVRALPADAILTVDGRQIGTGVVIDVPIPPGRRTLRVSGQGYQEFDTLLTVEPGKMINLGTITLKDAGAKP